MSAGTGIVGGVRGESSLDHTASNPHCQKTYVYFWAKDVPSSQITRRSSALRFYGHVEGRHLTASTPHSQPGNLTESLLTEHHRSAVSREVSNIQSHDTLFLLHVPSLKIRALSIHVAWMMCARCGHLLIAGLNPSRPFFSLV